HHLHIHSFPTRRSSDLGFTAMEVVTLRVTTTAILLITYVYITSPDEFKLHSFRDIKYFLGTGIVSIIFFNYCLFTAIDHSTKPVDRKSTRLNSSHVSIS